MDSMHPGHARKSMMRRRGPNESENRPLVVPSQDHRSFPASGLVEQ